jgi:transposase
MDRVIERGCGLDVHKKTVAACVRVPRVRGVRAQLLRTFGTTTPELLALGDWLAELGVTHVAMESTGVYWKPVFSILEARFTCLLANAIHIANVPGRKTDVQDCAWLAQPLEHGLLRGNFVPPVPIRKLRDLTRSRKSLIEERTRETSRLHKVLEDAGIKLTSVATDVLGKSGRAILRSHHPFLLTQLLAHIDYLDELIEAISEQVTAVIQPFTEQVNRLDAMPGVNRRTAEVLIAEVGVDMTVFPVQATTRVRANDDRDERARGTAGYGWR